MGRSIGAPVLAAHHEEEEEDLFETSSFGSDNSNDEVQFSDGDDAEVPQQQQQLAPPGRRLDSDCLSDLSSMKAQLPIKKGLSQYYDGKSQSFACMSEVRCLEDLRKKERPYKKIKSCKSYIDLDCNQKVCRDPGLNSKAVAKKPSSGSSCANLMARSNSNNMLYMPPAIPVNKSGFRQ